MSWLQWLMLVAGLAALFAAWDLLFCGGRRCKGLADGTAPGHGIAPGHDGRTR
jgi:hypothetical protein